MDCQGLVVRLLQDFVLLTTAVEVAQRWRELAEKLAKVSKQQMDAYESPHRDRNGVVDSEVSGAARREARGGGGAPSSRGSVAVRPALTPPRPPRLAREETRGAGRVCGAARRTGRGRGVGGEPLRPALLRRSVPLAGFGRSR